MRVNRYGVAAVIAAAGVLLLYGGSARGGFVNGIEDFNGTAVDGNTWVRYTFGQGNATVSNGYLDFSGQNYLATRSLTVGVGEAISARVMLTAASDSGTVIFLGLTTTPAEPFAGDRVFLSLLNSIQGESDFTFFSGGSGHSASGTPNIMGDNVGTWYRLQLRRTTPTDYVSELFTDSGSSLFSLHDTFVGLPDQANVFIGLGPTARFDWVAVPEPAAASVLAWGGSLLLRRRRRGSRAPR